MRVSATGGAVALLLVTLTACTDSEPGADRSSPSGSASGISEAAEDVDLEGLWNLTSATIGGRQMQLPEESALTLVVAAAGSQAHGMHCCLARADHQRKRGHSA